MGSKTKPGEKKPRPQAPTGSQVVRSLWIIDLGTQENEYKGVKKLRREIQFTFELVQTNNVFSEDKGEEPFVISMRPYSRTLDGFNNKKSNLNKFIDDWRGRELDDKEKADGIDFETFLDKPALATIISNEGKGENVGKKYSNISVITKLPKEMRNLAVPLRNKPLYFEIGYDKNNAGLSQFQVFELLPKFIQEKIEKSPEWKEQVKKHNYVKKKEDAEGYTEDPADKEILTEAPDDF